MSLQLPAILSPPTSCIPALALTVSCRRSGCRSRLAPSRVGFRFWASPFPSRLANASGRIVFNMVLFMDWQFVSGCSPPRLSTTQLPSTTDSQCSVRWGLSPHCWCALSGAVGTGSRRFNRTRGSASLPSFYYVDPHLSRGADQRAVCRFFGVRVHILHLHLHDIHDLFLGQFANLYLVRLLRTGCDIGRLFQKDRCWRCLGNKREGLVFIDSDHYRQDIASLFLRSGVKFLAESHNVHAILTERRTDRRRRIGLTSRNLQLDRCNNFFCHILSLNRP